MRKKFLSLVLACSLMVGSLPAAVYADNVADPAAPPATTQSMDAIPTPISGTDEGDGDEDNTITGITPAILVDKSATPLTQLYTEYEIEATSDKITISAQGLRRHTNGNGKTGYWVGFALAAPDGATQFKYAFDDDALTLSPQLDKNINADGADGVAFYFDAATSEVESVSLQWLDKDGNNVGEKQTWEVDFVSLTMMDIANQDDLEWMIANTMHDTIYLTQDITLDRKLVINKDITIDGDTAAYEPCKILGTLRDIDIYISITGGDVTLKGINLERFASAQPTMTDAAVVRTESGYTGTFTAKDVNVSWYNNVAFDIYDGKFLLDDCEITCRNGHDNNTDELIGVYAHGATGTIKNCTIISDKTNVATQGILVYGDSTVDITGCLIGTKDDKYSSNYPVDVGIYAMANTGKTVVNLSNNTMMAKFSGLAITPQIANSKDEVTGTATINVKSGQYEILDPSSYPLFSIDIYNEAEGKGCSFVVTGGTFNTDPSDYVTDGYITTMPYSDTYAVKKAVAATAIAMDKSTITAAMTDHSFELGYTLQPANSTDTVTITSSNPDIVKVEYTTDFQVWVMTPIAPGTATITATTSGGKTATCTVKVIEKHAGNYVVTSGGTDTPYETIEAAVAALKDNDTLRINANSTLISKTIVIDKNITITAKDTGANIYNSSYYSVSNPPMIKVTSTGNLTLKDGIAINTSAPTALEVDGGTATIDNAELTATGKSSNSSNAVSVTNKGTLHVQGSHALVCAYYNPAISAVGSTINIKGGTIERYYANSVNKGNQAIDVWNSLRDGESDIDRGMLNISGGHVSWAQGNNDSTLTMTGGTVDKLELYTTYPDATNIGTVSGGIVKDWEISNYYNTVTFSITGGTFYLDPSDYVSDDYTITEGTDDEDKPIWTVGTGKADNNNDSDNGGGGGGGHKKNDTTKTDETKTDEVKTDESSTIPPGEATTGNIDRLFNDTKPADWYAEAVVYAYNKGLMQGHDDGSFGANDNATRGQIVTILHRLMNEPTAASGNFTDITGHEYYAAAVTWAAANDIVNGYEDGTFGANDNVTREELVTILYRFAKSQGIDVTQGGMAVREYSDWEQISDWAMAAMQWAVNTGLIKGDESGALNPGGNATRAEIATILMRFNENIMK